VTGGRRHPLRSRRKYEIDRFPNEALIGEQITITRKVRGKNVKTAIKTIDSVNLAIDSKIKRVKIIKVLENSTNNDYKRRGIISKGAILETEEGKCRVVSRPGQHGTVNAILVK
jgi:small subunit ribosomal protein S8e